jgi:hypothetical protein
VCVCVCYVQRLGLLKTLMLAWQRQRTMDAGGVRHTEPLVMVATLPSRLLAIIGREVLKLPREARSRHLACPHTGTARPHRPASQSAKLGSPKRDTHSTSLLRFPFGACHWQPRAPYTCRSGDFLLM